MAAGAKASLELRDTAISMGIVVVAEVLSALAFYGEGSRGFSQGKFSIVFLMVPATIVGVFSLYARRRNYSAKPIFVLGIFSALFSFIHFLFWANLMAAMG